MKCLECQLDNPPDADFCVHCTASLKSADETQAYNQNIFSIPRYNLSQGYIFADKYEIMEKLGGGGMGVVYKARDIKLKRFVALKLLPPELTRDDEARERFTQEAQAASILDHPNICTIHEIDEDKEGKMFISMACYQGETVHRRIKRGPLPINEIIEISIQVAQGLEQAHSKGIMHRDIKPSNLIITESGLVKIVDFGLAKLADITRTSKVMGTAAYMSPEQAGGKEVDHRTDLWSLGVVIYEMTTSCLPFPEVNVPALIHAILNDTPPAPREVKSEIPEDLDRIILRCMRKQPEDRFSTARVLISRLEKARSNLMRPSKLAEAAAPYKPYKMEENKEQERRLATVMFVEISGINEILATREEEEVVAVMGRCLGLLNDINSKYGGLLNKITGSRFSIFFGIPKAIEDAPKRAVNAAIELRNKVNDLNQKEKLNIHLDVQIGINTGTVIAGALGGDEKKDYSIMGETVVLASHLKDISREGQIFASPMTYKHTKKEFEFRETKKTIPFKGKVKSIPVYELLSIKEKIYRAGPSTERMIYSELVGREEELAKLELYVLKAMNEEGSVISLIGETGIGKSRLIAELKKKEAVQRTMLLQGRALSIGRNFSFHPIIDVLKSWSGIKEDDTAIESFHKLEKRIRFVYPEGINEVFPFVATLMGMKLSGKYAERVKGIEGEALEKLILKNFRDLLTKATAQKTVVFIIEDLHWADLSSLKLLESLYRLASDNRILFINVFRPDYPETGQRILRTIKDRYPDFHFEMYLEALKDFQSEVLVNNLLKVKNLPANIKDLIAMRTEGNPFFIEEVVRSFIDEGVVEIRNGRFRITDRIESVVIPETINEVLMARIDKLDIETQSLVRVASVIGRSFFHSILQEVLPSVGSVDERLDNLKEAQIIKEQKRKLEVEYTFKHALAWETVYDSILVNRRKELHLQVARAIESVFQEKIHEFYGKLALHYSLGGDLDKAEEYMLKAGKDALKASASSEALNYYQETLNIYMRKCGEAADPEKIAMLEKNIAVALFNKGQYVAADEHFVNALSFYGEKFPRSKLAVFLKFSRGFLSFLIHLYMHRLFKNRVPTKSDSENINLLYKKNTALIVIDPKRMFVESFYWLDRLLRFNLRGIENGVGILSMSGAAFSYSGVSFRLSRKVLEFVEDKVDRNDIKSVLYYELPKVIFYFFFGEWDEIGEYDEKMVEQNIRIGELFYSSSYILVFGQAAIKWGDLSKALALAGKIFEIADVYENDNAKAAYYWFNTQLLLKFRKLQEAYREAEEGIQFTKKTGFQPYYFSLCAFKAKIALFWGNAREAEEIIDYLSKIESGINMPPYILYTYLLSWFSLDLFRLEESKIAGDKIRYSIFKKSALKIGKKAFNNVKGNAENHVEIMKLMGEYYWMTGRQAIALKWWRKGIKKGRMLGAKLDLSRLYMNAGQRLCEEKSRYREIIGMSGEELLDTAREMFAEMNLQWDLERLDQGQG